MTFVYVVDILKRHDVEYQYCSLDMYTFGLACCMEANDMAIDTDTFTFKYVQVDET